MNEELNERERLIFRLLKRRKKVPVIDILKALEEDGLGLAAKRASHSLAGMMKYLAAKVCQDGWIISMVEGGRGMGNKAVYGMQRRFKP